MFEQSTCFARAAGRHQHGDASRAAAPRNESRRFLEQTLLSKGPVQYEVWMGLVGMPCKNLLAVCNCSSQGFRRESVLSL